MAKRNLKTRKPRQTQRRGVHLKWATGHVLRSGDITAQDRAHIAQASVAAMWRGHKRYPSPLQRVGIMPADHARLEAAARRRITRGKRLKWIQANDGFGPSGNALGCG